MYMLAYSLIYMTSTVPECNSCLPLLRLYFIGHTLSFFSPPLVYTVPYLEKCSDKIILKYHRRTGRRTEACCYTAMLYLFPLQSVFLHIISYMYIHIINVHSLLATTPIHSSTYTSFNPEIYDTLVTFLSSWKVKRAGTLLEIKGITLC